mgnify:CR=1 FL=1
MSGMADFQSHHIEGYAAAAMDRGVDAHFKVGLISQIDGNLWMGGCIDGVNLGPDFKYVLSLYPWERYQLDADTKRLEVRLYDSADIPPAEQLYDLAEYVNGHRAVGRTLVHCQAGLNRSGLITALALHLGGMSAADAISLLREKRCPMVLCNQTFEQWLLDLDAGSAAA